MGTAYIPDLTPNCPNCGANEWEQHNDNWTLVRRCKYCGTEIHTRCAGASVTVKDGAGYASSTGGAGAAGYTATYRRNNS